jgi:hypothetical protein
LIDLKTPVPDQFLESGTTVNILLSHPNVFYLGSPANTDDFAIKKTFICWFKNQSKLCGSGPRPDPAQ